MSARTAADAPAGHVRRTGPAALALGALGVVFGDIGTSPLYAYQQIFTGPHGMPVDRVTVFGALSLVFWTLMLVVSVKYVLIVMRADNDGEGGIMALAALTSRLRFTDGRTGLLLMGLGVFGASLFYGDSMITPAVSVMSAMEGLEVAEPALADLIVPSSVAILIGLFAIQRWGTGRIGGAFGPVMLLWFLVIGVLGLVSIVATPEILGALSPGHAVAYFAESPGAAFLSLGSVILCVTGAEALYADMGHFGAGPIRLSWFAVAAPALCLNYFGQGALVLREPPAVGNPFYQLVPDALVLPMVILAAAATVIASQAVITGAFSMTEQAIRLRYLPRMTVRHTSATARGQIYLPTVNWILAVAVIGLVLGFRSSESLAAAYGLAVSGTFLITTVLITVVARARWHVPLWLLVPVSGLFVLIDGSFVAANLTKVDHGGWFPLLIAAIIFVLLTTWRRGRRLYAAAATAHSLSDAELQQAVSAPDVTITDGTAVYLTFDPRVPLALSQYVRMGKVFRRNTLQVVVESRPVPRVNPGKRIAVDRVFPGFTRVFVRHGFMESVRLPQELGHLAEQEDVEIPEDAIYVVRGARIHVSGNRGMMAWRKRLFAVMMRNAADPSAVFGVDERRVIEFTSVVRI